MAFVVPTFPITADVWAGPVLPVTVLRLNTPCQLRAPGIQSSGEFPLIGSQPPLWQLLVPAGTDVRDPFNVTNGDVIECPPATGRYYAVVLVDDVARGFSNEYRLVLMRKAGTWPSPIP